MCMWQRNCAGSAGSTLADIPSIGAEVQAVAAQSWDTDAARELRFDIVWDWVPSDQRHGREIYNVSVPSAGEKTPAQDSYSLRAIPRHGAGVDAVAQANRVLEMS